MYITEITANNVIVDDRSSDKLTTKTAMRVIAELANNKDFNLLSTRDTSIIAVDYRDNFFLISSEALSPITCRQVYDEIVWERENQHSTFMKIKAYNDCVYFINEDTEEYLRVSSLSQRIKSEKSSIKEIVSMNISFVEAKREVFFIALGD